MFWNVLITCLSVQCQRPTKVCPLDYENEIWKESQLYYNEIWKEICTAAQPQRTTN